MRRLPDSVILVQRQCISSQSVPSNKPRGSKGVPWSWWRVHTEHLHRNEFYSRPMFCPAVTSRSGFLKAKCLFLGTPHRGSKSATLPAISQQITNILVPKSIMGSSPNLIAALKAEQWNNVVDQHLPILFSPFLTLPTLPNRAWWLEQIDKSTPRHSGVEELQSVLAYMGVYLFCFLDLVTLSLLLSIFSSWYDIYPCFDCVEQMVANTWPHATLE